MTRKHLRFLWNKIHPQFVAIYELRMYFITKGIYCALILAVICEDESAVTKVKKLLIIFILFISVIAIIFGILKYAIVPKIVIPEIRRYIAANFSGQVNLVIRDISFSFIKGFIFQDIELKVKDGRVLSVKSADIDLALLPLLRKRIELSKFQMSDVNLTVGRDANGAWNFSPIVESGLLKENDAGGYKFIINEFIVKQGKLDYFDYLDKENVLERHYENVDLYLTKKEGELYELFLSGNALAKDESIKLILDFNISEKNVRGFVKLNTKHLGEYWHYYLDELLFPWNLKAEDVSAGMNFSYINSVLELEGGYEISKGIISYGDLSIRGNAIVKQKIKYVKGAPKKDVATIDLSLNDVSSSTGEYVFLNSGKCAAVITEKGVEIKELTGIVKEQPVNFSGNFIFTEPKELCLKGKVSNIDNDLSLKLLSDNQGILNWIMNVGSSSVMLNADISDLKNMFLNLTVSGMINLSDLSELLNIDKNKIKGEVNISGGIKGEWDKISSLQGAVTVRIQGFSFWDLQPLAFNFDMNFTDGILRGQIPKIDYYKGKLYGDVRMDYNGWGMELNLEKCDIEEFSKTQTNLKGMRGILTGKFVCICDWGGIESLQGGGYVKLTKCDLWNAPIFSSAEKGIESVTTEIEMPVIKSIDADYKIEDKNIVIENAFCDAQSMDLDITGKISFSGMADLIVGAKFAGKGLFKIAKNILIPVTLGIDFVTNCIQVRITGEWPNLEQNSQVQPMGWLTGLFSGMGGISPDKYNLEELWGEQK